MKRKAVFVKAPFQGWCRRIGRGKTPPGRFNYVDSLFWKQFSHFLKKG